MIRPALRGVAGFLGVAAVVRLGAAAVVRLGVAAVACLGGAGI